VAFAPGCGKKLGPKTTRYEVVIHGRYKAALLCYCSLVWWPAVEKTFVSRKLAGLQSLAITGAMRTTPSLALNVLLCLPELSLWIRRDAAAALQRMECGSTRRHRRQHRDIRILGAKVVAPDDDVRLRVERKFKVEIPTRESLDSRSVTSREGVQSWYIDGSKSTNTGWSGAGVYRQDSNKGAYFSQGDGRPSFRRNCFVV